MDRNDVTDRHVVARFLSDQLSEEESQAFQQYMLAHPEIVHELESTARFKVGLHILEETGELTALLKPKAFLGSTRNIALAASVAIVALGLFVIDRTITDKSPALAASMAELVHQSGARQPIARTYAILRTRGNSYDAEINLPAISQAIELRVLPEVAAQPKRYRASLARIGDDDSLSAVGEARGLVPAEDGFIALYVDSSKLQRGRYRLALSDEGSADTINAISTFKIKVIQRSGE